MGKTVRFNPENKGKKGDQFRHPRRNRAEKGMVRPKALPPDSFDDLNFSSYEENWHAKHPEQEPFDPMLKRNKSKWREEARKMRNKNHDWQEFDDDEAFI